MQGVCLQAHWENSGASISRLGMNVLIVCILFVLQASAQYYRQINMMRSELSYAKVNGNKAIGRGETQVL